ncbi:MAG: discoidin domain-containing protein [Clostridia bacterium]|nr:discoidin domain-containing protein [Clostridia bacterium]
MKKIISFVVAAVMALSVFGMLHIAAPVPAAAAGENLALGKTVTQELGPDTIVMPDPTTWGTNFLTDGVNIDNYIDGVSVGSGWYILSQNGASLDGSAIIDLETVYEVCRVRLDPEYHFLCQKFPKKFEIYVSEDGVDWTMVYKEINDQIAPEFCFRPTVVEFDKTSARYVKVHVSGGCDLVADGNEYAGISEIAVYDTYETGNVALGKTVTQTLYNGASIGWADSGAWDIHGLTDGSQVYWVNNNGVALTGWIVTGFYNLTARLTVDLGAVYSVDSMNLVPMFWDAVPDAWDFPNSYDVMVSADGSTWTNVYRETGRSGAIYSAREISFDAVEARYVVISISRANPHPGDASQAWVALGDIQVFGTFVRGSSAPVRHSGIFSVPLYAADAGDIVTMKASDLTWNCEQSTATFPYTITYADDGVTVVKQAGGWPGEDTNIYTRALLPFIASPSEYPFMVVEGYSDSSGAVAVGWDVPNVYPDNTGAAWYEWLTYNAGTTSVPFTALPNTFSYAGFAFMGTGLIDVTLKNITLYRTVEAFRSDLTLRGYYDYGLLNYTDYVDVDGTNYLFGVEAPPTAFTSGEVDGDYVVFKGWMGSYAGINGVGYVVDDGEPVFDEAFIALDAAAIQANSPAIWDATAGIRTAVGGTGDAVYYNVLFDIEEGEHTVKLVFDLEGFSDYIIYEPTSYTYTDVEYGIKTASLLVGDSLTLSLKARFADDAEDPKILVTNAEGAETCLEPIDAAGDLLVFKFDGIYPQMMADEFTLELYDGDTAVAVAANVKNEIIFQTFFN